MKGIFNGIQSLISSIETVINAVKIGVQFLINLVKSMFQLVQLIITTVTNVMTLTATLPQWLIAFATCTLGVAVLYIIIGRDTGK